MKITNKKITISQQNLKKQEKVMHSKTTLNQNKQNIKMILAQKNKLNLHNFGKVQVHLANLSQKIHYQMINS